MRCGAVADEHRTRLLLRRLDARGGRGLVHDCGRRAQRVHRDDRSADLDRLALLDEQCGNGAGERRRQLDERLRGLDLHEHLVDGYPVAGLDLPRDDLGLGQALADIRQRELG